MLRVELRRAVLNRAFLLAILLGVAALGYRLTDYCFAPLAMTPPFSCNAYDAVIWSESGPVALIVPLLAVLPFADSYALDRGLGYVRHVLVRSAYRSYLLAKLTANALTGGLAVAVPILVLFGYANLAYPRGLMAPDASRIVVGGYPFGPFGALYRSAPDLYVLFLVCLGFLVGVVYATLGLAISCCVENRYVVLATPFLLYNLANFVFAVLGLANLTPPATFVPEIATTTTGLSVFGELTGIFAVSVACLLALGRKERIFG